MITKLLVSAVVAFGAAVGIATPALADPTPAPSPEPFGTGSCLDETGCYRGGFIGSQSVSPEQMSQAFHDALADLQAIRGQQ
jgi:hypothetical protein